MEYFGETEDCIKAQCNMCGEIHRVPKTDCTLQDNKYILKQPIECKCGYIANELIPEKPPYEKPKRKSFWDKPLVSKPRVDDSPIKCPKCGSTQITANKKDLGAGKAIMGGMIGGVAGGLIGGSIGLIGGSIGKNKLIITCLKCGHQWKAGKGR
ncbi:hypothetical protein [Clostridium pasteurianum]|uniref:Uncharacterized protein n=1 Tax=Clostridium pasteurianum BC1 TaxID=86416 RepID=R4K8L0_CLOPA|nr:hypothetical protein [Clostridium pasteurianum]AGK98011.1 hypothetical protein Clopa_3197 [Clostridium pasteurianum BC1]